MVVFIALLAIVALMIIAHRHSGPAQLAVIAGAFVYRTFGDWLVETVLGQAPNLAQNVVSGVIFLILVVGFPMLLYFRSQPGRIGLIHLFETLIFASVLVAMAAPVVGQWITFDSWTLAVIGWVEQNLQFVTIAAIISAYYDIFFTAGRE